MIRKSISHYGSDYFNNYQKKIGELGGILNKFKFQKHISKTDTVLDFGCGGGFLLNNLNCEKKIGVELNDIGRNFCNQNFNFKCHKYLNEVPDNSVDIVISNHCLEHTPNPDEIIGELYRKIKKGGKIVICIPLDSPKMKFIENDVNFHLYSFSPINLGNLLVNNKFIVKSSKVLYHKWLPKPFLLYRVLGVKIFHFMCFIYGRINTGWVQVIGIGIK